MTLPVIRIVHEKLARFDEAIRKEWLVTNGVGGYAASTVLGLNTRKYHGLLVAALSPPGDRTVCLAKLDEDILIGNNIYRLGANEFSNDIFPQGYQFLKEFVVAPFPKYTYIPPSMEVKKTIFMPKQKNSVTALYKVLNRSASEAKIRVYPLLTCRHFHTVIDRRRNPLFVKQNYKADEIEVNSDSPQATIASRSTAGKFIEKAQWIEHLHYREEADRGEGNMDDCYQPGYFEVQVPHNGEKDFAITTVASADSEESNKLLNALSNTVFEVNAQLTSETMKRQNLIDFFYTAHDAMPASDWLNWILLAADSFLVEWNSNKNAIIAGYYWFETWGRDTFVSLPGLLLATARFEAARRILLDFMRRSSRGLIPNFVQDKSGESAYNTVDATLWYINAVLQYVKYTGDFEFVKQQLWEELKAIMESHEKGTEYGIFLDGDNLLAHGPQLTWMDAQDNGKAVTPRTGKAVEIQALWYNALKTMQFLANKLGETNLSEQYAQKASEAQKSFNAKFWNSKAGCLFDVVEGTAADASIRPNQIIAIALDFNMLNNEMSEKILDIAQHELVTPNGLRTLAPTDPRYIGQYHGARSRRDQAYHNGTVWPWLLGPFVTALLKTKGYGRKWVEYTKKLLLALFTHQIQEAGLGTLGEIFDGDAPYVSRGCIAQAWSVAEPFRAYVEDIIQIRPRYEKEVLQFSSV
jgi:predicted glycogen debranching enzyme